MTLKSVVFDHVHPPDSVVTNVPPYDNKVNYKSNLIFLSYLFRS